MPVKSKLSEIMGTEDDYAERLAKYNAAAEDACLYSNGRYTE